MHGDFALALESRVFSMPKTYELTNIPATAPQLILRTKIHSSLQYFWTIIFLNNFVKRNRLTKQYDLRLGTTEKVGIHTQWTFASGSSIMKLKP